MTQPQEPSGPPARFCSNCGSGLSPDGTFCAQCGTATPQSQPPVSTPIQQVERPIEPPVAQVWQPSLAPALADLRLPASISLAGRGSRLGAALIDGVMYVIAYSLIFAIPIVGLLALGAIIILQIVLLTKDGQTLGKKMLGVRIVEVDTGRNGGFVPNVLLRVIVNGLLGLIPLYGIVEVLFIFRQARRCIHDLIAGTHVIEA